MSTSTSIMNNHARISADEMEWRIYKLFSKAAEKKDVEAAHNRRPRGTGEDREPLGIMDILSRHPAPVHPPDNLVMIVKGFMAVEMLLPDYIKVILSLVRDSAGRQFFLGIWNGEEAFHHWALDKWLEYAGVWEGPEVIQFYKEATATAWDPITHPKAPRIPRTEVSFFADPWYGNGYVTLQEKATSLGYRWLGRFAKRVGQDALAEICKRLAMEEMGHHTFYRNVSEIMMAHDPERFIYLFEHAYEDFEMPAKYTELVDYVAWSTQAGIEGVIPVDPRLQAVLNRREKRQSPIPTPELIERSRARAECWNQHVKGMQQIFNQLNIPMPPKLRAETIIEQIRTIQPAM